MSSRISWSMVADASTRAGSSSVRSSCIFEQARNRDVILVLDECPYLRDAMNGLDSIVQTSIDRWRESSRMKIVLCGSCVEVMRSLLEASSPLYGRMDLARELGWRMRSPCTSGPRFSKIVNANEVFGALSQGYSRWRGILDQSHVSSGPAMTDVLSKLIEMGLVQRRAPINDAQNKRKANYFIVDSLSLFYYRYVFRYSSQRQLLDPDVFFDRYVGRDFEESYVSHVFEEICRQCLVRKKRAGEAARAQGDDVVVEHHVLLDRLPVPQLLDVKTSVEVAGDKYRHVVPLWLAAPCLAGTPCRPQKRLGTICPFDFGGR